MAYYPAEAIETPSVAPQETAEIGGLRAEAAESLTQPGEYVQNPSANLDGLPQIEFENTEDFSPNGQAVNITIDSNTSESTPAAEVPQKDGGLFGVVGDIIGGGVNHLIHNPLDVVKALATGVVLSIAVGAVAAAAAPIIAAAPLWVPVAGGITLAAGALGLTASALAEHAPQWFKDGEVVWNASKYTAEEVAAAHKGLNDFGAGAVDFTATMVGAGWMAKHLVNSTAGIASKTLGIEGKIIDAEYRVIDDVLRLPGPGKT